MIWRRGQACIFTLKPVRGDLVVMTTLNGRVAALDSVGDYDDAINRALTLAGKNRGKAVHVMPMSLMGAVLNCGISIEEFMADISDEELRDRTIAACVPLLDHPDPRERAEARALLEHWGAIQ